MKKDEAPVTKGAFVDSLTRTASQIRKDRAEVLAEDAEVSYRRHIDDMERDLKRLKRDRRNNLDLSPTDINSLVAGKDFNGEEFVEKDIQAGVKIRNLEVKITIAKERYEYLFGDDEAVEEVPTSEPAEVS